MHPIAYLRFCLNPAYEAPAAESQKCGWLYAELPGDHFHMLVEPGPVAEALIDLSQLVQRHVNNERVR